MKTILIVDDNPANLALLEETLKERYDVVAVTSGMRALTYLQSNKPDMIMLDIEMPIMNGIQTLEKIREMQGFESLPVAIITARKDVGTVAEGFKLGIVDYITKPFEAYDIYQRIGKILGE